MDFDDFMRRQEEVHRKRFSDFQRYFNQAMRDQGDPRTFDDCFNAIPKEEVERQLHKIESQMAQAIEVASELMKDTTDEGPMDILLRAMGIYRSIIRHVKEGGTVKFHSLDGVDSKTLKVRLRKPPSKALEEATQTLREAGLVVKPPTGDGSLVGGTSVSKGEPFDLLQNAFRISLLPDGSYQASYPSEGSSAQPFFGTLPEAVQWVIEHRPEGA